ncbi:DUF6191 domain-containing protein [Parafrankia soli]|uniref:DUF6191 domain-containing protein n=1 Tax=Parafrankia soli TaxID=2599596 RepID=UPI001041DA7F|nr:DUF6191 domain-containing protein [Parafrankia soli]
MREGIAEHRDALDRSVGDAGATHILNNLPGGAPAGTSGSRCGQQPEPDDRGDRLQAVALLWFMTIPGLVCALILLAAVDRFTAWATTRSWLPWQRRPGGRSVSTIALDELEASFYAGKRHQIEQRRTEEILRDDDSESAPPHKHLEPGQAIVRLPVVAAPAASPTKPGVREAD